MDTDFGDIIAQIERKRDAFVQTCNAAIAALKKAVKGDDSQPRPAEPKPVRKSAKKSQGPKKAEAAVKGRFVPPSMRKKVPPERGSVRKAVRDSVMSQTKLFTNQTIRTYAITLYPALTPDLTADRVSREIYYLRTREKLLEIEGETEQGGAHTYRKAA